MAGIGFRLREIVTRKTFTEWLQLYVYSAVIFAGPWLMSIVCLAALSFLAHTELQREGVALFTVTVVYCYAFSLITTGLVQLPVTRYVADRLYARDATRVVPSFVSIVVIVAPIQALSAAVFLAFCELSLAYKVAAMGLYVAISIIWMAMVYLTAAKDYRALVLGFFVGYLTSFALGKGLGHYMGVEGLLSGFLAGQTLLCFWLSWRILEEFPNTESFNLELVESFKMYPELVVAGLAYSAAIWVDKFVFWYGTSGIRVHSLFYTHFPYDSAMFFAYLTIIPTLALFLVRVETEFYTKYKAYFGGILAKESLASIERRKDDLLVTLRRSMGSVIIYQGAFTLAVLVLVPWLLGLIEVAPEHTGLFRVACIGAVFQVLLLVLMVILLYFDFRRPVMLLTILFLVLNGLLSALTLPYPMLHGWGYLVAGVLTLVAGLVMLWTRLRDLEYLTFVTQPISHQKIMEKK